MDINKVISIVRRLKEDAPTMSMGGGGIAGSVEAGDDPPVGKKTRKPTPVGRYGSRRVWLQNVRDNG